MVGHTWWPSNFFGPGVYLAIVNTAFCFSFSLSSSFSLSFAFYPLWGYPGSYFLMASVRSQKPGPTLVPGVFPVMVSSHGYFKHKHQTSMMWPHVFVGQWIAVYLCVYCVMQLFIHVYLRIHTMICMHFCTMHTLLVTQEWTISACHVMLYVYWYFGTEDCGKVAIF